MAYTDKIIITNTHKVEYFFKGKLYKFLPWGFNACVAGLKKDPNNRFMLCSYYVRTEPNKPKLIGYNPKTGKLHLYEVLYADTYQSLVLNDKGEWQYEDKFGNKKIGWRVITPNQFNQVFCVRVDPKNLIVTENIRED